MCTCMYYRHAESFTTNFAKVIRNVLYSSLSLTNIDLKSGLV